MQPFSTQTSSSRQRPSNERGTHAPSTQTCAPPPQSLVIVHGVVGTVQRSTASQLYDDGQVSPPAQDGTHFPSAQTSPDGHCVWSKHWSAGAVHTPLTQRNP